MKLKKQSGNTAQIYLATGDDLVDARALLHIERRIQIRFGLAPAHHEPPTIWVAKVENRVVGTVGAIGEAGGFYVELVNLVVDPKFRRQEIGTALLDYAVFELRRAPMLVARCLKPTHLKKTLAKLDFAVLSESHKVIRFFRKMRK